MTRAVTADHVMFNECIPMFRPENIKIYDEQEQLFGYLLLDFKLQESMQFTHFTIQPSIEYRFPGAYAAFITPVVLPRWFEFPHNLHLFSIALSAVISFISGRPAKAPRDDYMTRRRQLDENTLVELALQYPVLTAGPGAHDTHLSNFEELKAQLQEIVQILFDIPYNKYISVMQSIRLVQLAHLIKRDDFALGYYLLVSAIEITATEAIKRKDVIVKHPLYEQWQNISKTNYEVLKLLNAYQKEIGNNHYIGKRFVNFVMNYCPPDKWSELEHPYENMLAYASKQTNHDWSWATKKRWDEIYPEDLTEQDIRKILSDIYKYRSNFTHKGEYPPNRIPESYNRYFDKELITKVDNKINRFYISETILPNFRLISFLAKRSIFNYIKQQVSNK